MECPAHVKQKPCAPQGNKFGDCPRFFRPSAARGGSALMIGRRGVTGREIAEPKHERQEDDEYGTRTGHA
jgi:hypothetical protein